MKKLTLLLTPLLLLANSDIQNRVTDLENQIRDLKQEMRYHQDDLDERMPIIEEVEKRSILDKINFSPELELRFDKMDYKIKKTSAENTIIYSNPDPAMVGKQRRDEYSKDFNIASSIRFRLNMNAVLSDDINFHGRLVFQHSSQSSQRLCILSRDVKSAPSYTGIDLDRAYINYKTNKGDNEFTLSFGILPTTGGTPMQFAQNTQRESMFPALVFDMNTYGIIGTQKFNNNNYLRLILAKAYTLDANIYPYQCNRENIDNANVAGLYVDSNFNFLGKSLLSFGVNMLHDLKAHPYLGPDVGSSDSHVLGNMFTFGLGMDIQKFADEDLSVFIHTALSNPHGNGAIDDYQIVSTTPADQKAGLTASGKVGFSEADYAQGEMLQKDGYSFYLGTKYDISKTVNIGAEYNYGSQYWFSATQGAQDMYNKLAIRGHVAEIYGVWKFHKNLHTKFGYMYTKENFTGSGWHFGEPANKDAVQNITYLTLNAKF